MKMAQLNEIQNREEAILKIVSSYRKTTPEIENIKDNVIKSSVLKGKKIDLVLYASRPSTHTSPAITSKKKIQAKNKIPKPSLKLMDLEKMYNKIHSKDLSSLIIKAHNDRKALYQIINRPVMHYESMTSSAIFDIKKIKEIYNTTKRKNIKAEHLREQFRAKALERGLNSKVVEDIYKSEKQKDSLFNQRTKLDKYMNESKQRPKSTVPMKDNVTHSSEVSFLRDDEILLKKIRGKLRMKKNKMKMNDTSRDLESLSLPRTIDTNACLSKIQIKTGISISKEEKKPPNQKHLSTAISHKKKNAHSSSIDFSKSQTIPVVKFCSIPENIPFINLKKIKSERQSISHTERELLEKITRECTSSNIPKEKKVYFDQNFFIKKFNKHTEEIKNEKLNHVFKEVFNDDEISMLMKSKNDLFLDRLKKEYLSKLNLTESRKKDEIAGIRLYMKKDSKAKRNASMMEMKSKLLNALRNVDAVMGVNH